MIQKYISNNASFFSHFHSFPCHNYLVTKKTTLQAKYYYKLFSFQQDDPQKRRSSQRPQYSGKKCDLVTPKNTWTALKNSSGRVCDPRCEEVLVLEEMGRKDKIQQKFNPHKALGWFSNRTGTSVDDGERKLNNWLDQWQSDKLGTGSRVYSFPRTFPSSTDISVLLLNQPIDAKTRTSAPCWCSASSSTFLTVFWFSNTE